MGSLSLLENPVLSRNDTCPCGSGRKYKKCCLKIHPLHKPMAGQSSASFLITEKPLHYEDTPDMIRSLSAEEEDFMKKFYHIATCHPEEITSPESEYMKTLRTLRMKYPKNPVILNYLSMGYQCLKMTEEVKALAIQTYEEFPNYLFGRTARAQLYLQDGDTEKAMEVMGYASSLKELHPNREIFHITEFVTFEEVIITYLARTGQMPLAAQRLEDLETVIGKNHRKSIYLHNLLEILALDSFRSIMNKVLQDSTLQE